jgi:flagellar protein FliL
LRASRQKQARGKDQTVATAVAVADKNKAEEAVSPPEATNSGGRRKLILLGAPVLLVAAVGSGLWFTGILPRLLGRGHDQEKVDTGKPQAPIYVDLPEMIVNLNSNPRRPNYVKLVARLEVTRQDDVERVKLVMPRLQDLFQTYLREMRPEELRGSAGTYRLREELIGRANLAAAPARISDVLFTQMMIQ